MRKQTRDVAWIVGLVYFTQGALGVSSVALLLYLRSLEWTIAQVTMVMSGAAFPWLLKIFYGILSDSFPLFGFRRKSYLICFLFVSSLGWLGLIVFPSNFGGIFVAMLMTNLGLAATDVVTDGLIVEHSTAVTSHIYQSIAWGSRSSGAIVGSILGGWLAARWHPHQVFFLTLLLPLLMIPFVLRIRERKCSRRPFRTVWGPFQRCWKLLRNPRIQAVMLLLGIVSISSAFGIPFFFFMKEHLDFHETFLGILGSLGWLGAMLGSLIYLTWLRRYPPALTLRWAIIIYGLNILATLAIHSEATAFAVALIAGIAGCLIMLPVMSLAASLTHHTGIEGFVFAILMSIYNLGQIVFGFLGGRLYEIMGLQRLIVMASTVAFLGLIFSQQLQPATSPSRTSSQGGFR